MHQVAPAARKVPPVLWPLLFGNFVIGTGVMVVPGTLGDIGASLKVSTATAGQLITAGAVLMCLGAPFFASVVGGMDRRRLLALSMLWYAMLHAACVLMPTFGGLLPVRALAMAAPAIFTPQAAACAGLLVDPAIRGRAITFVFLGWSVASIAGMPLGAYIGGVLGWRAAFGLVSMLSLVSALWVWWALPHGIRPAALSWSSWQSAFRSRALMLCVAVTVASSAGQFVLFAYFAPYYQTVLDVSPSALSALFLIFGAFGLIGNLLMSRYIDRLGAARAVLVGLVAMAFSLLLWPLGNSVWLAALIAIPWALGCFSSNSAQQARLVALAPGLASGSIALNTSAMYAGQAIGAGVGGWMIAVGSMQELHWAGLAGMALAIWLSRLAAEAAKP